MVSIIFKISDTTSEKDKKKCLRNKKELFIGTMIMKEAYLKKMI